MIELSLTNGGTTIVDDDDGFPACIFQWAKARRGRNTYAVAWIDGKKEYLHRFLLNFPDGAVDHRDGDGLNNRRNNLRRASHTENARNSRQRAHSRQPFKGVEQRGGSFRARIVVAGRRVSLGSFDTGEQARAAYNTAARNYFREFARAA